MKSATEIGCERLAEYLGGTLDERERASMERALHMDDDARVRLNQLRLISDALASPVEAVERLDMLPRVRAAIAARVETKVVRPFSSWTTRALSVAAAACVVLGVCLQLRGHPTQEFQARGSSASKIRNWAGAQIYRAVSDVEVQRVADSIARGDRLLFSYTNLGPRPYSYLMLFAVDGHGRVFWFYPSYVEEGSNPRAIAIDAPGKQILPDLIEHEYSPGPLTVEALFTQVPLNVLEVEEWLRAGPQALESKLPSGSRLQSTLLKVTP